MQRLVPDRHFDCRATVCVALIALSYAAASTAIAAPGMASDLIPNLVGLGVGSTPQFAGGKDRVAGVAPGVRYQFQGSEKFFEWYGTLADVNLVESRQWQFGPALNIRLGRSDVDDPVVSQLPEVDTTLEGGVMLSYTYTNASGIPYRLRVGAVSLIDLGDTFKGMENIGFASLWVPLSPSVFVGLGGGFTWASASFNQAFFGVTPEGSAASGLAVYSPGSGVRQWYAWPAVVWRVAPQWFVGTGAFYQRITGDAADSPLVRERGDRNQWTVGIGVGYAWR